MSEPPGHGRGRRALALGVALAVVYLAGAALSGRASPLARQPLLDGLAPPTPYRWVHPPAELAAGNKPPAGGRFLLELTAQGSQLSAFSTSDGQVNLILSQGAVPFRAGQIEVVVTVEPLDPTRLAAPAGMLVAGNAYRLQAAYRSSGRKVSAFGGESSVILVYPLLAAPVADPAGHVVLTSVDGRSWSQLPSTDTPGSHQVSAQLRQTGYFEVGVPPGAATAWGHSRTILLLAAAAAAVAGLVALQRLLARRAVEARRDGRQAGEQPLKGPGRRDVNIRVRAGSGRAGDAPVRPGEGGAGKHRAPPPVAGLATRLTSSGTTILLVCIGAYAVRLTIVEVISQWARLQVHRPLGVVLWLGGRYAG